MSENPDFGPSGYLPERASKRARKIVLRAPLGAQWIVASLVAGVVVLVAGLLFLRASAEPPGPPFTAQGPVAALADSQVIDDPDGTTLLVTAGGRVRAFVVTDLVVLPAYCPTSNRIEGDAGVWTLTGRGLGVPSLAEHPTVVVDGIVYVDFTTAVDGPPPGDEAESLTC